MATKIASRNRGPLWMCHCATACCTNGHSRSRAMVGATPPNGLRCSNPKVAGFVHAPDRQQNALD